MSAAKIALAFYALAWTIAIIIAITSTRKDPCERKRSGYDCMGDRCGCRGTRL